MFKRFIKSVGVILAALLMGYAISNLTFSRATVSGHSMDYTLHDRQGIWVNHLPWNNYHRGDIVVLRVNGIRIVKRIVAVGGDTVEFKEDDLYINGKKVNEPYVTDANYNKGILAQKVKLEKDEFIVLGDNRDVSNDSRYFGVVQRKDIIGKVLGYESKVR